MFCFSNLINHIPEIIILIAAIVQLFCKRISSYISFSALALAMLSFVTSMVTPSELYSYLFKIMISLSGLLVLCLYSRRRIVKNITYFNFIYLFAVFFLIMIASVNNYLALYINVELFSITLYFLLSVNKSQISYPETIKYMISSSIASAFLLLGAGFIYGLTGTLSFQGVYDYLTQSDNYSFSTYIVPYIFIITGILFKLGVFPFGNWVIDIYKNTDTKIAAFISVVPKLAIFSVFVKILGAFVSFETSCVVILFALFTGMFGAVYGIKSTNLKVIMACSSYINISYMLIALALYTKISISAMLFYWITYIFMNIGAFAGIIALEHSNLAEKCFDFRGYFYKNPVFSTCFGICIISLLGFPITGGFVAKLYLLAGVLNTGIIVIPLILAMVVIMIMSAVFYLNIIKRMFMIKPYEDNIIIRTKGANRLILYTCTVGVIMTGLFPAWFIRICESIAIYL